MVNTFKNVSFFGGCWWLELKGQKIWDWPLTQGKNWQIRRTKCKILLHWQIKAGHQDASGNLKYSEMLHNQPQLHEKLYTSTCQSCFQASLLWCLMCVAIAFAQLIFRRRLLTTLNQAHDGDCLQRDKQRWLAGGSKYFFHPYLGMISNLTNIFQPVWNHQPDGFHTNEIQFIDHTCQVLRLHSSPPGFVVSVCKSQAAICWLRAWSK